MLDKTFDPKVIDSKHYERSEQSGAFKCDVSSDAKPHTIMMPPPNVTGSLHMGHALNTTLQDILTRYYRMKGRDSLWQPGMDHAGIATQMVVERQLAEKGDKRRDMSREEFVDKVWEWKDESGGMIENQMRKLGATPDWDRSRFTMDEGMSQAVLKTFVKLYEDGLIYRDQRLVNWDPKLQTAVSDLEVEHREIKGKMYHFRYPYEDGSGYVSIATTRPETILADGAVAVHPDDERYKDLVGRFVIVPVINRIIPVVADEHVKADFGSGAVKITAAHDFNDFEVYKRHKDKGIPLINLMTPDGKMNENCPEDYQGLTREEARKKVVADFDELDYLDKIEPHKHQVPYGDRSGVVIEPYLTDQWYCDAQTLAKPALEAVRDGRTKFVPQQWENTYFSWLENIQPWCISRQLWWGHQIPAWYGPDGHVFVAETEDEAYKQSDAYYTESVTLKRDEDVLDTWFSSALWPFSTLGWPDERPELARYYPGDVLITGFDIIFFWVARMMMMGLYFMDDVPFHTVYMHALVRDASGAKMSKSKGNVMDPLELTEKFGADALRFTLTAMAAQGRDIKLSEDRIVGYRNFCTKLWNASRYCEMNQCMPPENFDVSAVKNPLNQWIIGQLVHTKDSVEQALETYKFNEAAGALYQYTWGTFCDWYLEFTKPLLEKDDEIAAEIRSTTGWVLEQIYILLNPFMPFMTEELHQHMTGRDDLVMAGDWPDYSDFAGNTAAAADIGWLIECISEIRSVRADMNVPPKAAIDLIVRGANEDTGRRLSDYEEILKRLAKLNSIQVTEDTPKGAVQIVLGEATLMLPIADIINLDAERLRLQKQIERLEADIAAVDKKLANENFVSNAPEEVVAEHQERKVVAQEMRKKLEMALQQLVAV